MHALRPVVDLVVNNINTFETLVKSGVGRLNLVKFLAHHYEVLVAVGNDNCGAFAWLSTVKCHLVQTRAQLFICFF